MTRAVPVYFTAFANPGGHARAEAFADRLDQPAVTLQEDDGTVVFYATPTERTQRPTYISANSHVAAALELSTPTIAELELERRQAGAQRLASGFTLRTDLNHPQPDDPAF